MRRTLTRPGAGIGRAGQERGPVAAGAALDQLQPGRGQRESHPLDLGSRAGPSRPAPADGRRADRRRTRAAARSGWRPCVEATGARCVAQVDPLELELDAVDGRVRARPPRAPPARCRKPTTGPQPSFAAAIASTPDPVPRSTSAPSASPASASSSSSSRQSAVVAWAPVPNACPGSMIDINRRLLRLAARDSAQDGRTTMRPSAIETGWWKSRQRSAQSSGISVELISTRPSPGGRLERRATPAAPRAGRRSRTRPSSPPALLLDPARRQLEQVGEHALGELGPAANGEPDHARPSSPATRAGARRALAARG